MNVLTISCALFLVSLCNSQPFFTPEPATPPITPDEITPEPFSRSFQQFFNGPTFIQPFERSSLQSSTPNTITVTGSDIENVETNIAVITLAVGLRAKTSEAAQGSATAASDKILAFLSTAKVSEISNGGVSLVPNENFSNFNNNGPAVSSYTAISRVTFEVAVKDAENVLGGAAEAGANRLDRLSFKTGDAVSRVAREKAIRGAIAKARSEATIATEASGKKLGELVNIQVVDIFAPRDVLLNNQVASLPEDTKISPQKQQIPARVMITYRIF